MVCSTLLASGQALPLGTEVLEEVTFSLGDPDNAENFLENLSLANFRQFPGEVILVVYHASW